MNLMTAKVVRFHETGDASVLKIEDLPVVEPAVNELRIKVEAIGLNRAEVMFRNGAYLEMPEFPSRLGYEAAGIVDAVGEQVTDYKLGDRVSTIPSFSMGQYGVYAEYAVVPVHAVAHCPESLTVQQSAAIWMQYMTAYGALLVVGQLKRGQHVIITAASSSVGVAAIQIAKSVGATVIATTRGKTKKQFLLDQGADQVITTNSEDLVARTMDITHEAGVELVFDPIGGPILNQLAEASAKGGRIIEYGALDAEPTPYPLFIALAKGLTIHGYTLFEITQDKIKIEGAKEFLLPLFETGKLIPVIDKEFTFNQIQDAHRYMESNQQTGKIIVTL
ncbi:Quinone oxidoreductase [hydrothermal vent metagenome]|uniref:Quinone oxidoreductase n=1 Tax=hydrothermal vent metagenome TaxID=652676 RepID=A0A3B1A2U8_9ZZZZ